MRKKILAIILLGVIAASAVTMTGCGDSGSKPVPNLANEATEPPFNIDWAMVSVTSEGAVEVSVADNDELANKTSTVNKDQIDGELCSQVNTFADFDDSYSATYDMRFDNLETGVFHLKPSGAQKKDKGTYGINYFSMIQEASTMECDEVIVKYMDKTEIKNQKGEFELVFYPASQELANKLGYAMTIVKGSTGDTAGDITCTVSESGVLSVSSTVKMTGITVEQYNDRRHLNQKDAVITNQPDTDAFDFTPAEAEATESDSAAV